MQSVRPTFAGGPRRKRSRVGTLQFSKVPWMTVLRDDDDVSRFDQHVFVAATFDCGVVIKMQSLLCRALPTEECDPPTSSKIREALRHRQGVEHRRFPFELIAAGHPHVPDDRNLEAVN